MCRVVDTTREKVGAAEFLRVSHRKTTCINTRPICAGQERGHSGAAGRIRGSPHILGCLAVDERALVLVLDLLGLHRGRERKVEVRQLPRCKFRVSKSAGQPGTQLTRKPTRITSSQHDGLVSYRREVTRPSSTDPPSSQRALGEFWIDLAERWFWYFAANIIREGGNLSNIIETCLFSHGHPSTPVRQKNLVGLKRRFAANRAHRSYPASLSARAASI